jgi:SPP1 gp7 family putative phage head morphogenesis protein
MSLKSEILDIKQGSEKQAVKQTTELLKAYRRNLDDVRSQIANIYAKYTIDGILNISTKQRYSVLVELENQLAKQMQELGDTTVTKTTDILSEVFKESYYQTAYAIDKGKVLATLAPLKKEFVTAAVNAPIKGVTFSKRIWSNVDDLAKRVKTDVEKALIQGQSVEKLARKIKNDFGSTAYQAKRLINTETAKVVTAAQDEIYKDSVVVQKVLFDATLDNLTSDICQELDGKEFDIDDHPEVPQHPNCRSCIIPVVDGWSPTSKLENIKNSDTNEKTVIDYSTYSNWRSSRGI